MKVIHIISGLSRGGAERALSNLVLHDKNNTHRVVVFKDYNFFGEMLIRSGISVYSLGLGHNTSYLKAIFKLYKYIQKVNPDVVQTWMFHADLFGGLIAKVAGIKKIFWGVRAANIKLLRYPTRIIVLFSSIFSYVIPKKIICCGFQAKNTMSSNLYSKGKLTVIHNGCDTNYFSNLGAVYGRAELDSKILQQDCLVGFFGRWDIYKDIPNLLSALKITIDNDIKIKCLFAGIGLDNDNKKLCDDIDLKGLSKNIILLGERDDIPELMRGIDINILPSISEGFPNVLVESLACGTPCIATDVGDSSVILGDTGWLVPHSNPHALANALIEASTELNNKENWVLRKKQCRDRVIENFSINKMVSNYIDIWES